MIAPLSLSNVLTVVVAVICLWTTALQSSGGVVRRWRLAIPPCLAAVEALVLLAGVFDATFVHDAEWLIAAILGAAVGRIRGWAMPVTVDRTWGLLRLQRTTDGLLAAFGLVVMALTDFASAAFEDPLLEPEHVAAISAFCAGFLCCRALAMAVRAERAPHVELAAPEL